MNNKYLIAVDLDGTLLKDDKTISKENLYTLKKLQQLGHKVMISTGRPFRSSKQYYHELGLQTPIVNLNGAYVHHPKNTSFDVVHHTLPLTKVKDIVKACETYEVHKIMAEVRDDIYLKEDDDLFSYMLEDSEHKLTYGNLIDTLKYDPTSMLIKCNETTVSSIEKMIHNNHADEFSYIRWRDPNQVLEIMKRGVSKASGLMHIGETYNIPKERMIAFGDEMNDKEMLSYVEHGIAMGNALEEIKDLASDVTKTNEENGIAHYLQKFFKLSV